MLKMFSKISVFGLLAFSAFGQSNQRLHAKVPFAFLVWNSTFSAGDYRLTYSNTAQRLLIQSLDKNPKSAFVGVIPASGSGSSAAQAQLVFHCHGNTCYLAQVWQGAALGDAGFQLPPPEHHRELALTTRVVSLSAE